MSQAEWPVCEPLLPAPAWPVWRALPADFPPAWTVYWWADKWQADGSTARMHDDLRERIRLAQPGGHRFPV